MIYSWLYNKVYNFLKKTKDLDPEFSTSCIIFLAQGLHFVFVLIMIRYFLDVDLPRFSESSFKNKVGLFPIAIVWLLLVHYYFKKRIQKIQSKYGNKKISKLKFFGLLFLVLFLPLYIMIKISGGQLWKF